MSRWSGRAWSPRDLVRQRRAVTAHDRRVGLSIAWERRHSDRTSMFRYYMTPETRQAVIAESNRLIAARAAVHAGRRQADAGHAPDSGAAEPVSSDSAADSALGADSAFGRLVLDLQLTALRTSSARPAARQ
jgi:hypothetical protein